MALLSLKINTLIAVGCFLLVSCDAPLHKSSSNADIGCRALGDRLHTEQLGGTIYGDIKTRVHFTTCPDQQMAVAFIGQPPKPFADLQDRAKNTTGMVHFKAVADGFVVRESDQELTFIVLTLDNIVENKSAALPEEQEKTR